MSVTHTFTSGKADGGDATLVQPSNWNAAHTITSVPASGVISTTDATAASSKTVGSIVAAGGIAASGALWCDTIISAGTGTPATFSNSEFITYDTYAGLLQVVAQNLSGNAAASTDFVATADTGTDTTNYINFGINSSAYSVGTWTINGALDGYLHTQSSHIAVGTGAAGKNVVIFTGGTLAANARAVFGDTYQAINNATCEERLGGVIWTKTATTTLASFTTAATLIGAEGTGVGVLTLPANFLTVGRTIRIKMKGVYSSTTAAPTLNFLLTLQGVTIATSGAITMTTVSMVNRPWWAEFEITCRATGASATVIGNGTVTGANTLAVHNSWLMVGALANVNTAATAAIGFTVACSASNAANAISMVNCTIEAVG